MYRQEIFEILLVMCNNKKIINGISSVNRDNVLKILCKRCGETGVVVAELQEKRRFEDLHRSLSCWLQPTEDRTRSTQDASSKPVNKGFWYLDK